MRPRALLSSLALSSLVFGSGCKPLTESCQRAAEPICKLCGERSEACTKLKHSMRNDPGQCEQPGMVEAMELLVELAKDDDELRTTTCDELARQ